MDKVPFVALSLVVSCCFWFVGMFALDAWQQSHGKVYQSRSISGVLPHCNPCGYRCPRFAALRGSRKAVEDAKKSKALILQ